MPHTDHNIDKLADHLFRHESGKMVAVLTKVFGTQNLELAEDVVQDTLLKAIQIWKLKGIPDQPTAWLYRVAKNKAIDLLRKQKFSTNHDFQGGQNLLLNSGYTAQAAMDAQWKEELMQDDLLHMMYACCHPEISEENQITLILKTLCGFSTLEIAKAFITSEDTVSKRLYRTKAFFRKRQIKLELPSADVIPERTAVVLNSIYLIFNEGYNSAQSESLIRKDLLMEALMLCRLLTVNPHTQLPEVFALMALMCFHASRTDSRLSPTGEIILLDQQDRTTWNQQLIAEGNYFLNRAAFGESLSAYHVEAAIAFEHCTAKSFAETNWQRILDYYNWLSQIAPSPITEMNKAVVIMEWQGPRAALDALQNLTQAGKLEKFYLYHSLLGEIYLRLEHFVKAKASFKTAWELTKSKVEKKLLQEKIILVETKQ